MTESDLNRIEAALGIRLPPEYRELMRHYPFGADSVAQDCALPDDAGRVITENHLYRKHGFFGAPWPSDRFAIGTNGFGDTLFLDLSLVRSPVYCAQHENGACVQESPGLGAWAEELAREEAAERQRTSGSRWWQVWRR